MAEPTYLNFDLQLEPWEQDYRAMVVASPLDRACCSEFSLPLAEDRPGEMASLDEIKAYGTRLFRAVFDDEVYSYLRRSQDEVDRQGADGLRIRLILTDVPELADLPWEYLYDPSQDQFLSLSTKTPIVRYLDLSQRIQPLSVQPPLRVLVMISAPEDQPPLDVDQEWEKLSEALAGLQAGGRIMLELLEEATLPVLQTKLRQERYHVFHYVGHGIFDEGTQDGLLLFEDADGLSQPVRGEVLGTLLHNEPTLRLAVLNACEGAKGSRTDPFAGVAQSLVRKDIPAVIAMQTAISDVAAKAFAEEFYRALADDYPVDKALTEARMAIYLQGNEREWGTPVLFMRASDAYLDRVRPEPAEPQVEKDAQPQPQPLPEPRPEPLYRRRVNLGPVAVPLVPLMAVPLLLLAALAVLGFGVLGPAEMEGRFNIALADVTVLDGEGNARRTDESERLTGWLVSGLTGANTVSAREGVEVWHDGLPLTEKRTQLGGISGQSAGDRAEAAGELAEDVNAHVVVYGHVGPHEGGEALTLEFYVAPRIRVESVATIGRYRLGDPIAIPEGLDDGDPLALESLSTRVEARAGLLSWLLLGLRDDLLGRPSEALATMREAEDQLTGLRERGDGKEHLYYFKGRAALFMDFYDEAESALQKAVESDPGYARAQIALGSVYLDRAQTLQTAEERLEDPSDMERAISQYQMGLELAREANEPLTEVVAHLALAQAYRLKAETHKGGADPDFSEADRLLSLAVDELRLVLDPLAADDQHRLLAQAYSTLGLAYLQHGQLLELQGEQGASRAKYQAALEGYDNCIRQGDEAPEDEILRSAVIEDEQNGCRHWAEVTQEILDSSD